MTTSLRVIATIGLPASGKSSWAREFQAEYPGLNYVLVSKDEIRAMIYGNGTVPWTQENERLVEGIRDQIIQEALGFGRSVIVHDTNLARVHLKAIRCIAKMFDAEYQEKTFLDVDVEECVRRDALRGDKSVGKSVIHRMRDQYKEWWEYAK